MKFNKNYEANPKQLIYEQIQRCSLAFSEFDASAQTINALANMYDTEAMEQKGKRVANSVLTLESLISPFFTKEFTENEETNFLRAKAFFPRKTFEELTQPKKEQEKIDGGLTMPLPGTNYQRRIKRSEGFGYMDSVPEFQQESIMDIQSYFGHLVRFAFSLPMFSETKNVVDDDWNETEEVESE